MFGPSVRGAPTMASADFWPAIPAPLDAGSPLGQHSQISPGIAHPPSRLCLSDLRRCVPCKYRALTILAASPRNVAFYPLPVRQASALPSASFRFAVARDTLAVRLTVPLAGPVEDFHLLVSAPCRAHQKKRPPAHRGRPSFCTVTSGCRRSIGGFQTRRFQHRVDAALHRLSPSTSRDRATLQRLHTRYPHRAWLPLDGQRRHHAQFCGCVEPARLQHLTQDASARPVRPPAAAAIDRDARACVPWFAQSASRREQRSPRLGSPY